MCVKKKPKPMMCKINLSQFNAKLQLNKIFNIFQKNKILQISFIIRQLMKSKLRFVLNKFINCL